MPAVKLLLFKVLIEIPEGVPALNAGECVMWSSFGMPLSETLIWSIKGQLEPGRAAVVLQPTTFVDWEKVQRGTVLRADNGMHARVLAVYHT